LSTVQVFHFTTALAMTLHYHPLVSVPQFLIVHSS